MNGAERKTDRQIDRQIDRQTDTQTNRQTDRQTELLYVSEQPPQATLKHISINLLITK